jgi:hypothetical protein
LSEGEFKNRIRKYLHDHDHPWESSDCGNVMNSLVDEVAKELNALINNGDSDEDRLSELVCSLKKWFGNAIKSFP